jgi:hypothetical protein
VSAPGKRFGFVAMENLSVGQLLLVSAPLIVSFGSAGAPPSNADLVQQLEGQQLSPWQLQWLTALLRVPAASETGGSAPPAAATSSATLNNSPAAATSSATLNNLPAAAPAAASSTGSTQLADAEEAATQSQSEAEEQLLTQLQHLLRQGAESAAASGSTAAHDDTLDSSHDNLHISGVANPFSTEQLAQLVAENAYSEASEDLGAALLRELDPEAVTGLWPEYALLNHSCSPNTVAVVVGRYLLLQAVTPVLKGEELTGSYLGKLACSPVAVRRAFLSGVYGFHCQCQRCLAEQVTFPTVYYPADNELLGIVDPHHQRESDSEAGKRHVVQQKGLLGRVLQAIGISSTAQLASVTTGNSGDDNNSKQRQRPPLQPSQQHQLLQQMYTEAAHQLSSAVHEAVTADTARQERQLALLEQMSTRYNGLLAAVESVGPQLQRQLQQESPVLGVKWLLAAAYPLLQLQVELIELLLASGQLPVDGRTLLYDDFASGGSNATSISAAGAAAAARLSSMRKRGGLQPGWTQHSITGSRGQSSSFRGLKDWLSQQGQAGQPENDGPVTKRQLLGWYVDALERNLQVVDSVARGSEDHIIMALKHLDASRQLYGADAVQCKVAEALCSRAHAARYGLMKANPQLLAALISARRRQLLGFSLAQKMSVLAWEASIVRD